MNSINNVKIICSLHGEVKFINGVCQICKPEEVLSFTPEETETIKKAWPIIEKFLDSKK